MARFIDQEVPGEFEAEYRYVLGRKRLYGFQWYDDFGAYYGVYDGGLRRPAEAPAFGGIGNPNVSLAADAQRRKFGFSAGAFASQDALGAAWAEYFGPRPRAWWELESAYGGDTWFAGFCGQELRAYDYQGRRAWQKDDEGYVAKSGYSAEPDTSYSWGGQDFELMVSWKDDGDWWAEWRGAIEHDAVFVVEFWVSFIQRSNCTGAVGIKVYGVAPEFDVSGLTWNNQPVYDTLLGTMESVEVGDRGVVDGAEFEKFAFVLDTSAVERIDEEVWASIHVNAHAVQVGPW